MKSNSGTWRVWLRFAVVATAVSLVACGPKINSATGAQPYPSASPSGVESNPTQQKAESPTPSPPAPTGAPTTSCTAFTDTALNASICYPNSWYRLQADHADPRAPLPPEQDFSNHPDPVPHGGDEVLFRFAPEQSDRSACFAYNRLGAPQVNVAQHDVPPAAGVTYTTEPPPGATSGYGFGGNLWLAGRCVHFGFFQYSDAVRQANRALELAIIDSLLFN